MPRPKKYQNEAERQQARRASNKRHRDKKRALRETEALQTEADNFGFENIQLAESSHRPSKEARRARFEKKINELSDVDTIQDIFTFNFDVPKKYRYKLQKRFGKIIQQFLDELDYTNKYVIRYNLGDRWRSLPLDDKTAINFVSQLDREGFLENERDKNTIYTETDYDFFPVAIAEIKGITIERLRRKTKRKVREGGFFKYICTFPINLEKFMIFNELNETTVKIICEDNCVVYACRQAGVDPETILNMKRIIKTRQLPQTKLKQLAEECGIEIDVTLENSQRKTYRCGRTNATHVSLYLIENHYLLKDKVAVSPYFIKHYDAIMKNEKLKNWSLAQKQLVCKYDSSGDRYMVDSTKQNFSIKKVISALKQCGHLKPIHRGDYLTYASTLYQEDLGELYALDYDQTLCTKLKLAKRDFQTNYRQVFYADCESSTDGFHTEYNICFVRRDGKCRIQIFGKDCVKNFLDRMPGNSLIYFHNLSYDINFVVNKLDRVSNPIIKNGRTMSLTGYFKGKKFVFKDSYSIIPSRLKEFPRMFQLESGDKEVFPYQYYSSELLKNGNRIGNVEEALAHVNPEDRDQFRGNIKQIKGCAVDDLRFRIDLYSNYYCDQDVNILRQGFEKFRNDLLKEFELDVYNFISISSIANKLLEREVYNQNGNIFELANTPREFISKCILGGRCMIADNQKQIIEDKVVDFDAVSLYPSAMVHLYVLEGIPYVLTPEMLSTEYLLSHLFDSDQVSPTTNKFISGFFVEIEITKIGIKRHFPLINDGKGYFNNLCNMYVDHITFEDLCTFQGIECRVLRGYYYRDSRDLSIRGVVENLFNLRLKYKNEGNPTQEIIKLLLNSIYGKTILKPIEMDTKLIKKRIPINLFSETTIR
jgi:hypothetical protein